MKKTIFLLFASAFAFVACKGGGESRDTHAVVDTIVESVDTLMLVQRSGNQCYKLDARDEGFDEEIMEERSYHISWPSDDHPLLQREILKYSFGDDAKDFDAAAKNFLESSDLMGFIDRDPEKVKATNGFVANDFDYIGVEPEYTGRIYAFCVQITEYGFGAAHPLGAVGYINYDVRQKRVVHLSDLLDTTNLSPVVRQAMMTLPENKEVLDCVFSKNDVYASRVFTIDLEKGEILMVYNEYEIGPYACGVMKIHLPIAWLSEHVQLTPYAKDLFHILTVA